MKEKSDWDQKAANLLKAELKRKGLTYSQLSIMLSGAGFEEKEANIRNKLSRGKFTASFLLKCLTVMGVKNMNIE